MARKPRVVAPCLPHHVTQRGNDRGDVFFHDRDRQVYLETFFDHADQYQLSVWGYCLMHNHVHFVVVPQHETSLARVFGRTHSDYARYANLLRRGCGHLWQARFYSCPLDTVSVWRVLAYVERNPVRAGVVRSAEEFSWSSARAHCSGVDAAGRLDLRAWRESYSPARWREVLETGVNEEALGERIRQATSLGAPLGSEEFVHSLEEELGRDLRLRPPGRPRKEALAVAEKRARKMG